MGRKDFHDEPFDEGTLNKLDLFEKYAEAWIPVFVSQATPPVSTIHFFDFFAGPGRDLQGRSGSPLRLLERLATYQTLPGWSKVGIHAHFSDKDSTKIAALKAAIEGEKLVPAGCHVEALALDFDAALERARPTLRRSDAAKLVLIDQTGIKAVPESLFVEMTGWPKCDFLIFLSSSTFHRFSGHPAIGQKIKRPDDIHHIHRIVTEYYRGLVPVGREYFLSQFSFKKGPNVYGLLFGSAHPLGADKFLGVAWKKDAFNGEADFDVGRDGGFTKGQTRLYPTSKVEEFEGELAEEVAVGAVRNETDILRLCYLRGVMGSHATSVLKRLKDKAVIDLDFRVPNVRNWRKPRSIQRLQEGIRRRPR